MNRICTLNESIYNYVNVTTRISSILFIKQTIIFVLYEAFTSINTVVDLF